jgi:hypothetical protein
MIYIYIYTCVHFKHMYTHGQSAGAHLSMLALLSAVEKEAAGERPPWKHGDITRYVGISGANIPSCVSVCMFFPVVGRHCVQTFCENTNASLDVL